jgi:hypothetical protein
MVGGQESNPVNEAIQQGLALCRRSVAPIVALAQFVDDLRADPNWRESDVRLVEMSIRRILARMITSRDAASVPRPTKIL